LIEKPLPISVSLNKRVVVFDLRKTIAHFNNFNVLLSILNYETYSHIMGINQLISQTQDIRNNAIDTFS
jgi:hypothetical protein